MLQEKIGATTEQLAVGRIPAPATPPEEPDQRTRQELLLVEKAKTHGRLTPKELNLLHVNRHVEHLEDELAFEKSERLKLQTQLNFILPRWKALEAIQSFDIGITTWASIFAFIGNALVAFAGFHDAEPGKEYLLLIGIVISLVSTVLILGVHKLWIRPPNSTCKTDETIGGQKSNSSVGEVD